MTVTVRVPGSTSNLGAGFDCLGLALDLWLEASLVPGEGAPKYGGTAKGLDAKTDLAYRLLAERDALAEHRLVVTSDIPIGKGLGSSAAAIVAGLALARSLAGDPLDPDALYRGAATEEGHPDNAGPAVFGGLVLAARRPLRLALHEAVGVALAVPARTVSTKAARDLVPTAVPRETAVQQAARSAALVQGLLTGDPELIGFGMDDRLAVPHRKGLIPGYDDAVRAGGEAGAFGVTISGAGSAVLAFGPPDDTPAIAAAMADALSASHNDATALTPEVATEGLRIVPDET